MSRDNGKTWSWRFTVLLGGAMTQLALITPGSALGQAPSERKVEASAPADAKTQARSKLLQARSLLAQGDFNGAEALAKEVAPLRIQYSFREDTPAKVLRDVTAARTDPKALLNASRAALARKDYQEAERYAKLADKHASLFTFPMWADSPAHVLKDIKAARGTANAPEPAPVVSTTRPAEGVASKSSGRETKADCQTMLVEGRRALAAGKLEEAATTAQKVKAATHISWGLFEDTPDKLSRDVLTALKSRNREEAARLLTEARKLYGEGKYDEASKRAYRSQTLFNEYSVWDLGDRPSKVLAACHAAQAKTKSTVPPATVVKKEEPLPAVTPAPKPTPEPGPALVGTMPMPTPAPTPAPAPAPTDANKTKATQMVGEAIKLHREGNLVAAREKALEAQALKATFGPQEISPDLVYQQLASDASKRVEEMSRQAAQVWYSGQGTQQARGQAAIAKLTEARNLAAAFLQDTMSLDEQIKRLHVAPGKPATTGGEVRTVNYTANHGQVLLEKARAELQRGEPGTARRLAEEALVGNHGVKEEALAMLRSIDTEEFNQSKLKASAAFDAAERALRRSDFQQARAILVTIDAKMLDGARQARMREINLMPGMAGDNALAVKGQNPTQKPTAPVTNDGLVNVAGTLPPIGSEPSTPGRATVSDRPLQGTPVAGAQGQLLDEYKQRQSALFQMMRQKGLEAQSRAYEKFRSGQHQEALDVLDDYLADLSETKLEESQLKLLRRPVDARVAQFKLLRDQKALATGAASRHKEAMDKVVKGRQAEELKKQNIKKLMEEHNALFRQHKFDEAEKLAMRAKELDPDDPVISAAIAISRMQARKTANSVRNSNREKSVMEMLNGAEDLGPPDAITGDLHFDKRRWEQIKKRPGSSPINITRLSETEKAIERKLLSPVNLNFEGTPLKQVIDDLRDFNGINIVPDLPAMQRQGISLDSPITIKLNQVSLKSALTLILHQAHLTYQIQNEVLHITTEEEAQGKQTVVTYNVADLVLNLDPSAQPSLTAMGQAVTNKGTPNFNYTPTPVTGPQSLSPGYPVGTPTGPLPPVGPNMSMSQTGGAPMVQKQRAPTQEEQLIRLLTSSVRPQSWAEAGGKGTVEFHPLTLSLVIAQTPDIQEQIQDLLQALRRLQDQSVSVEVRMITVTEEFFERIGVNFAMNILTDKANKRFEPQLLGGNFVGNPDQFINAFNPKRFIAGLTPAGTLTPSLDIPITQQSFFQTFPTFGGYQGGGLNVGLAFLSDIQVFLFLEALQGDVRNNVMQAPKITCYNGQSANVIVGDQQNFLTNVDVVGLPGGQFVLQPTLVPLGNQVFLAVQPVITADRRFVRINMQQSMQTFLPGPIPQVPVVVPLFTSFDGITSGQPVVFTQYLQTPRTAFISVTTTVQVPDGGTVVMGGLKRLAASRTEFGPPVVSKIPYLNRLFKNVGYGRDTESLLLMVSVRILILSEEEIRATGFDSYGDPQVQAP